MKHLLLITGLLFAGTAVAEDGYIIEGEHFTDEEMAGACNNFAVLTTIAYMARNILPQTPPRRTAFS